MKNTLIIFTALFALTAFAELKTTDYHGEVIFVEAISDQADFTAEKDPARYVLLGFASAPVILDVSDESRPVILSNYLVLESAGSLGAYLRYDKAGALSAIGEEQITEVTSIILD